MAERVSLMVERGIGPVLADSPEGLDLEREIRAGNVVVFSLRSGSNARAAQTIANLAFQDLVATFSRLDDGKWAKRNDLPEGED